METTYTLNALSESSGLRLEWGAFRWRLDHHLMGNNMKALKALGANKTQVEVNGHTVFFSYNTPVAANLATGGFVRTATKYSVTTSKHINQWLDGANARTVPQEEINALLG